MADKMDNILILRTVSEEAPQTSRGDSPVADLKEELKEAVKDVVAADYPVSSRRRRLSSSSPNIPWNVEGRSHGPAWTRVRYMSESNEEVKKESEKPEKGGAEETNGEGGKSAEEKSGGGDEDVPDVSDPMDELKADCESKKCAALKTRLEECNNRVNSCESETTETCIEEIMDFVHCIDHCVAKDLFKRIK